MKHSLLLSFSKRLNIILSVISHITQIEYFSQAHTICASLIQSYHGIYLSIEGLVFLMYLKKDTYRLDIITIFL